MTLGGGLEGAWDKYFMIFKVISVEFLDGLGQTMRAIMTGVLSLEKLFLPFLYPSPFFLHVSDLGISHP